MVDTRDMCLGEIIDTPGLATLLHAERLEQTSSDAEFDREMEALLDRINDYEDKLTTAEAAGIPLDSIAQPTAAT